MGVDELIEVIRRLNPRQPLTDSLATRRDEHALEFLD